MLTGKHLIAGEWVSGLEAFQTAPVSGAAISVSQATLQQVNESVNAAEDAFVSYGWTSSKERAVFLRTIAEELDLLGDEITKTGHAETGLPEGRLVGERGRTVNQLRLFADQIEKGDYLDRRHDEALPNREPLPRSDLKLIQRPIGPVAVFGASNFPLAFSTAGGDTASALAAGCPVIVKGHPSHAGTGELAARAIDRAIKRCNLHPGVFSLLQGDTHELGSSLVTHPLICAVGFTGSLRGGRALYDLCAKREVPIPFFGELGSINPVFVLPDALQTRGEPIAKAWAASLTMGAGQFCTNPGVLVSIAGDELNAFKKVAAADLGEVPSQPMLTGAIAEAYASDVQDFRETHRLETVFNAPFEPRAAKPNVFATEAKNWMSRPKLQHEVFGPFGIIIEAESEDDYAAIARTLQGQLTCTLHMTEQDTEFANTLVPLLERKAGRLLVNGFPTGVEVCDAMVHGGPYPASTNFGATSVGTLAIRRFLRPVCYQDFPNELLPVV